MAIPIRPEDLPAGSPTNTAAIPFDSGTQVFKGTPLGIVDAATPLASQAEAEAGTDNVKRVTSLRVAQAVNARGYDASIAARPTTADLSDNAQGKGQSLVFSAAAHGAPGDGSNQSTALQAYHDDLPTGNMMMLSNSAIYGLGTTLNITKSVRLGSFGSGEDGSVIRPTGATGDAIKVQSVEGFWLADIRFNKVSTRTAGSYVNLSQVYRGTMERFRMDSHFIGIALNDVSAFTIKDSSFTFPTPSATAANSGSIKVGQTTYVGKTDYDNLYFTSQQPVDVYDDSYQPTFGMQFYNADNQCLKSPFFAYQGTELAFVPTPGQASANIDILAGTFDYCRRNHLFSPAGGAVSHFSMVGGLVAYSHLIGGICVDSTLGEVSDISYIGTRIINHVKVSGSANPANDSPGIAVYVKGPSSHGIRFINCPMSGNEIAIKADACEWLLVDGCDFGSQGGFGPASIKGLEIASGVKGRLRNCRFDGVATPFTNLAPSTFLMDEWQDYTPVITSGAGTITTATGAGRYRAIGKRIEIRAVLTISNNGTGAQDVRFTLPPPPMLGNSLEGYGRTSVTGRSVQVENADATHGVIWDATNAYPGGVGTIRISGFYETSAP